MIVWLAFLLSILQEHTSALPRPKWRDDRVIYQDEQPWDGKSYSYGFQTLFGNSRNEKAVLKTDALGEDYIDVEGEYTYPSPDGIVRKVSYRANLFGYQANETKVGVHSKLFSEDAVPNIHVKLPAVTMQKNTSVSTEILPHDHKLQLQADENINQYTIHTIEENNNFNNNSTSDTENEPNLMRIYHPMQNLNTNDAIFFPTDRPEINISTEQSVLTTVLVPPAAGNATNETSADYYYDELGNRIGGVPPAVLGSLLG